MSFSLRLSLTAAGVIAGLFLLSPVSLRADDPPKSAQENEKPAHRKATGKAREEMLKKYDKNGDGKLDADERKVMEDALKAKQAERLKKLDKNGDGKVDEAERKSARETASQRAKDNRAEILKKFDKNGDGKLDAEERKAMREAMKGKGKDSTPPDHTKKV